MVMLAILISLSLSIHVGCNRQPEINLVAIGDDKVVGKTIEGNIEWDVDFLPNPNVKYFIVTPGFVYKLVYYMYRYDVLAEELKKCMEKIK